MTIPGAFIGVAYAQTLTASGGAGPYGFEVTEGVLPTGLTLKPDGTLAGTPSQAGTFTFTVTATDANVCRGFRDYSLTVDYPAVDLAAVDLATSDLGTNDLAVANDLGNGNDLANGNDIANGNGNDLANGNDIANGNGNDLGGAKGNKGGCGCNVGGRAPAQTPPAVLALALMLIFPSCWKRSRATSSTQEQG